MNDSQRKERARQIAAEMIRIRHLRTGQFRFINAIRAERHTQYGEDDPLRLGYRVWMTYSFVDRLIYGAEPRQLTVWEHVPDVYLENDCWKQDWLAEHLRREKPMGWAVYYAENYLDCLLPDA